MIGENAARSEHMSKGVGLCIIWEQVTGFVQRLKHCGDGILLAEAILKAENCSNRSFAYVRAIWSENEISRLTVLDVAEI